MNIGIAVGYAWYWVNIIVSSLQKAQLLLAGTYNPTDVSQLLNKVFASAGIATLLGFLYEGLIIFFGG